MAVFCDLFFLLNLRHKLSPVDSLAIAAHQGAGEPRQGVLRLT